MSLTIDGQLFIGPKFVEIDYVVLRVIPVDAFLLILGIRFRTFNTGSVYRFFELWSYRLVTEREMNAFFLTEEI